jgi:SAM-dependent methyltransferase
MPSPAEQIIGLYQRHARAWATRRVFQPGRLMEAEWVDRFLGLLPQRRIMLDLGCGSGEPIDRYLIERGCRLMGVDSSPEMIAFCKDAFPQETWTTGDMRTLSLGRRFDGILAWDSFFHLAHDDQRRMFPIFRAYAVSGTALMFTSGPAHGEAIGEFEGEALYHASLDGAEYRALLDENGFDLVAHEADDPTCGLHTIWLAQSQ